MQTVAEATPLGRELAQHNLWSFDANLWQTLAARYISCVGVVDRSDCDREVDAEKRFEMAPQATYHIAVHDSRWLEHLNSGMEWASKMWDQDSPAVCNRSWLTADVLALARGIENELAFDRLPILADALQEAGCEDEQLLAHCRIPGSHVRGCWAVDRLLRGVFDPQTLDAAKVRQISVCFERGGESKTSPPNAKFDDREAIDAVVAVIRSSQEILPRAAWERHPTRGKCFRFRSDSVAGVASIATLVITHQCGELQGTTWFDRWGEGAAWLQLLPDRELEWYQFRSDGRTFRVSRAAFVAALQQADVELPLACS